jgi:hypothetical protein
MAEALHSGNAFIYIAYIFITVRIFNLAFIFEREYPFYQTFPNRSIFMLYIVCNYFRKCVR